jgi:hypothetical protein
VSEWDTLPGEESTQKLVRTPTEAGREWNTLAGEERRVYRILSAHQTEAENGLDTLPGEARTQKLVSTPHRSWEGM